MSKKIITNPSNPEHFAIIEPIEGTMTVSVGDTVLCETTKAIRLIETGPRGKYPTVLYFPKGDLSEALQIVPGRSTHCPLKGDASYLSFNKEEVAWNYDRPLSGAEFIAEYAGFYSDKVNIKKA